MAVFVFRDNIQGRGFYEALGATHTRVYELAGKSYADESYGGTPFRPWKIF